MVLSTSTARLGGENCTAPGDAITTNEAYIWFYRRPQHGVVEKLVLLLVMQEQQMKHILGSMNVHSTAWWRNLYCSW